MEATEKCQEYNMDKVRKSMRQAMLNSQIQNMEAELREQSIALSNLEVREACLAI